MLEKFEVENFKNFENKIVLDLSNGNGYEFNEGLIKNGIVKGGIIFGKNASGKSNLGCAIFDIITHLTDKQKGKFNPYFNLNSREKRADFKYVFNFDGCIVEYSYSKSGPEELIQEKLLINNSLIMTYDFIRGEGECLLEGAETLNVSLDGNTLSFIKYVSTNTILKDNEINSVFKKFLTFIDNMLLFYSLDANRYLGYQKGVESISDSIVKKNKLQDFEEFLNNLDIPCELKSREVNGQFEIFNVFENGEANFYSTASTGTKSLALYYYWLINADDASLIFMDEFDAYYHFELSEQIVKETLARKNAQILFTSHNTNLMTNDIFRPDCLFIMQQNCIKSMSNLTDKELRKAHNLQKMYRAGAFNE